MDNKKGFTLVEVLIATAIMVSALGALVYALTQNSNLTETMRNQDIALNGAQQRLETIANDISNIMNYNNAPFLVTGLTPDPAGSSTSTVSPTAGTNNLFDVSVIVRWQERGGRAISRTLNTTLVNK